MKRLTALEARRKGKDFVSQEMMSLVGGLVDWRVGNAGDADGPFLWAASHAAECTCKDTSRCCHNFLVVRKQQQCTLSGHASLVVWRRCQNAVATELIVMELSEKDFGMLRAAAVAALETRHIVPPLPCQAVLTFRAVDDDDHYEGATQLPPLAGLVQELARLHLDGFAAHGDVRAFHCILGAKRRRHGRKPRHRRIIDDCEGPTGGVSGCGH